MNIIDDENRCLEKALDMFVSPLEVKPKSLLNLCCGNCTERNALNSYFRSPFTVNMDIKREMGIAQIVIGDADHLMFNSSFDIVFLRHPNVWEGDWTRRLKGLSEILDGYLIGTTFTSDEASELETHLRSAGYRIILSKPNPYAVTISDDNGTAHKLDKQFIIAGPLY